MVDDWSFIRRDDCTDEFEADNLGNFFPRNCCYTYAQLDRRELGLFNEEFEATEMICLFSKTYCCYNSDTMNMKFSSIGLNKHFFEQFSRWSCSKIKKSSWIKRRILVQPIEDSEGEAMQFILMNNRRKAYHSFIPSGSCYQTGFTRIRWILEKLECRNHYTLENLRAFLN